MRPSFRFRAGSTALSASIVAMWLSQALAQLPVFNGDPLDPGTGAPYTILPGVALVLPGADGDYGTGDDVIDAGTSGDTDVVVRVGGGFTGGPMPAPAASIATAPGVVAGGAHTGQGTEVPFQVILSDGAPVPPGGAPLPGPEHDGRALLVFAFPDLDGDGFVGPTDTDGSADNEVERQEALSVVGRQVGLIENGVGSGDLAVSAGAPTSAGGLGLVVVGGVLMGETAPEYFDGPWVATLLPQMPPIDPTEIIGGGGGVRAPEPGTEFLVEIKLEFEKWFLPAPNHPVLGTPYAIPLDGSAFTVDLLRSESAVAVGAAMALPVDPAVFTADPGRRLLAAVDGSGNRVVVEAAASLFLADDGPGGSRDIVVFPADLFGNPTDPGAQPISVTLEAGPTLRITAPDADANEQRETVTLTSAARATITIDDFGGANDGTPSDRITAVVNGAPTATMLVFSSSPGCGNSILDPGEACDDGNTVDGDGCQADCQITPAHDSVVLPSSPVRVRIREGVASVEKKLSVSVRNADPGSELEADGHVIRLLVDEGDCPPGTVAGLPDFDRQTAGSQDSVLVPPGSRKRATVLLQVQRDSFTSFNRKTPSRCRLTFRAETVASAGSTDPNPSNNLMTVELDVLDRNDADQTTVHETFVRSVKPLRLRIPRGRSERSGRLRAAVGNADFLSDAEGPGHPITLTVDEGDCPAGVLGPADFDRRTDGAQSAVTVAGGKLKRGTIPVTVVADAFASASTKSPVRCTATLSVSGPAGDIDPSNDRTMVVIDVIDRNDF